MVSIKDSLYAFACGDALGVPVEFEKREDLLKNITTKMIGFGSADVPEGTWSDDTSMTLATMDAISNYGLDYNKMADNFLDWVMRAKYTATDDVFDIGITTKYALRKYSQGNLPATCCGLTEISANGNGSLMRMLPIAFYCFNKSLKDEKILDIVKNASSITHAHEISILGCYIYVRYIMYLLDNKDKYKSYDMIKSLDYSSFSSDSLKEYDRVLKSNIKDYKLESISSSGYIVHTLEAVLWVTLNAETLKDSIICAVNLGDDTDTIGAITGSISGIIYGFNEIPKDWLKTLKNKKLLDELIDKFDRSFEYEEK